MKDISFYHCEKCKNMILPVETGTETLSCCGQPMKKLIANSTDASEEKHVPVVVVEDLKIKVTVGSVDHPMTADHYIKWIALISGEKVELIYLKPGMKPKAIFTYNSIENETIFTGETDEVVLNCEGQPCNFVYNENPVEKIVVYAYCNLHGLWKVEL